MGFSLCSSSTSSGRTNARSNTTHSSSTSPLIVTPPDPPKIQSARVFCRVWCGGCRPCGVGLLLRDLARGLHTIVVVLGRRFWLLNVDVDTHNQQRARVRVLVGRSVGRSAHNSAVVAAVVAWWRWCVRGAAGRGRSCARACALAV